MLSSDLDLVQQVFSLSQIFRLLLCINLSSLSCLFLGTNYNITVTVMKGRNLPSYKTEGRYSLA
jgi:hypothetical protein